MSCHVTFLTSLRSCGTVLVTCKMPTSSTPITLILTVPCSILQLVVDPDRVKSHASVAFDLLGLCLGRLERSSDALRFCQG